MNAFCAPHGRDAFGLSFIPIHLATAVAFIALAVALAGLLRATRSTRIAFLGGLTDGRQKLFADAFATGWLITTLIAVCGLNQALLIFAYLGAPYSLQAGAGVIRGSAAILAAVQMWRIWRGAVRRPT